MLDWIKTAMDYNYWAHHKLLDCLDTISDADFKKPVDYSIGSLHQQIVHVMWAEDLWYARITGKTRPDFTHEGFPTRESIREKWTEVEANWRDYVDTLTDDELQRTFEVQRLNGETYVHSIRDTMLHMVNHGTDHRAQMLELIHGYGGETFAQDIIYFLREQQ